MIAGPSPTSVTAKPTPPASTLVTIDLLRTSLRCVESPEKAAPCRRGVQHGAVCDERGGWDRVPLVRSVDRASREEEWREPGPTNGNLCRRRESSACEEFHELAHIGRRCTPAGSQVLRTSRMAPCRDSRRAFTASRRFPSVGSPGGGRRLRSQRGAARSMPS